MYGPERLLINSSADWGPSYPTAVPDFILAMRRRGHPESIIRKLVYDNPLESFRSESEFSILGAGVRHRILSQPKTALLTAVGAQQQQRLQDPDRRQPDARQRQSSDPARTCEGRHHLRPRRRRGTHP